MGGDLVIAGGNVRIDGSVGRSMYAAAGRLLINGSVGQSARIAGGHVDLGQRAEIRGNVTVGGGQVMLHGAVRGTVSAAGGSVYVDGPVGGDVVSTAGAVELGPNARITGRLRYASREEVKRDAAAQVAGGIERLLPDGRTAAKGTDVRVAGGSGWAWSIGLVAIAAVLAGALPRLAARIAETVRGRWPMSLLIGFIALVCIPVAALILLFTLVGVPLALVSIALYLALLLFGYTATGVAIGGIGLQRLQPAHAEQTRWRVAAAALGMAALTLLARIPVVGTAVVFAAMLLGIGALLMQLRRSAIA